MKVKIKILDDKNVILATYELPLSKYHLNLHYPIIKDQIILKGFEFKPDYESVKPITENMKDKALREQIEEIMTYCRNYARNYDENAAMANLPTPQEVEISMLLKLIREHDKRVIGEDEGLLSSALEKIFKENKGKVSRSEIYQSEINLVLNRNILRDTQRKRSEEELGGGEV